jgi:hypothetical protein
MEPEHRFELDGMPVSSTADGRMAVVEAVSAVTRFESPEILWKRLTSDHPEILDYCEAHFFQDGTERLVVGVEGWEKIITLLPEYLSHGRRHDGPGDPA